jgi:hypothetical protein
LDLTDELLQPLVTLGQIVEPELDELNDEGLIAAAALTSHHTAGVAPAIGVSNSVESPPVSSLRPLYLTLAQYRI